ncbi:MAG: hypothetical protein HXY34_14060, partial [Candidatus Thorarchaeota archaeon]|nr:hypothetical protein [Candidatus Thorarchaeota archaeon]
LPIAAVDNASRVIKYVVTLGQRYQSYSLVDMRVQDINVVANPQRRDPNVSTPPDNSYIPPDEDHDDRPDKPYTNSGTHATSDPAAESFYALILSQVFDHVWTFWTGFWPVLHIVTEWYSSQLQETMRIQIGIDILCSISLEVIQLFTPMGDGSLPDLIDGIFSASFDQWRGLIFSMAITALTVFEVFARSLGPPHPATILAGVAAVGLVLYYFYLTVMMVWSSVTQGLMTHGQAAAAYVGFIYNILTFILPGVKVSGYFAEKAYDWAMKRLQRELTEEQQKAAAEASKRMLLAKVFLFICLALFVCGFILHLGQSV